MRTIVSILCFFTCLISIPLAISRIIEIDRPVLFLMLLILMLPGFITSSIYLYDKYPD